MSDFRGPDFAGPDFGGSDLPPLNCGGCTLCCRGERIELQPDDIGDWCLDIIDGRRYLAHGQDGNCIYLKEGGCSIHNKPRPRMCQAFDCRLYFLQNKALSRPERRRKMKNHPNFKPVYERGRELVE